LRMLVKFHSLTLRGMVEKTGPSLAGGWFGFTNGQLEALKWIALASMFLDHFGRHLLGYGNDTWVFAVGRIAFPLFALVLAVNLAREHGRAARAARTARRLAVWCAVSIVPSVLARGEPMLVNVFGTLGLGAAICWSIGSNASLVPRVALCAAAAVASWHVEFGPAGVFLIPAIYVWCTDRHREAAILAVILLLLTGLQNALLGGFPAMLGTLVSVPIGAIARRLPISAPRLQLAFYLVYPLHLSLIAAVKALA
jgi:hypothetical protein